MPYLTAIITSFICLGAVCAIYSCRIFSKPGSWARGEVLESLLIAVLSGFFPLALGAIFLGLQDDLSDGFSLAAMGSAGLDFIALIVLGASFMIFLALVKGASREGDTQTLSAQSLAQMSASVLETDRDILQGTRSIP